jgi:hypothetical protein
MLSAIVSAVLAAAPLAASSEVQDVVLLLDGARLEGRVTSRSSRRVVLQQGSRELEIPAEEISSVDALEDRLAAVLEHLSIVRSDDVVGLLDLASVCEARGLSGEADLLYLRVLLADPANERANEGLGHRQRSPESYLVPHGPKWVRWSDRIASAKDWNDAWELETSHYRVRTNVDLAAALNAAFDLERFYLFFFRVFGSEIDAHHVQDRMVVHLHGDPGSFPAIGYGRRAYYESGTRRLVVDAKSVLVRPALLHEATHQILDETAAGQLASDAGIPAWLSEGLAEYMATAAEGPPGSTTFLTDNVSHLHVHAHASASRPIGLAHLLALESGDFLTSEDAPLYYAQSYSLVQMCLDDPDARYRDRFMEYLAEAYAGRASASSFRNLVAREDDFEEEWLIYVRFLASSGR